MKREEYIQYQSRFNEYLNRIHNPTRTSDRIDLKNDDRIPDFIKSSLQENNIFDALSSNNNWHNKFARFPYNDPYNALTGCREYIFFTRPDLNLLSPSKSELASSSNSLSNNTKSNIESWDLSNNSYLLDTFKRMPYLFDQWTSDMGPFMNMITNSARSTLELPGVQSKDVETATNIYGSKITYRGTSWSSDEQFDFSVEFSDNRYFEMYNLFKIYDEYERMKSVGKVTPKPIYRQNRIIHDQFTAFKLVVGPDGRELIYWGRAVGCYPTNYPRDSFGNISDMIGDNLKFTVQFKAHFARDFDPMIIEHFNQLSLSTYNGPKPTIENDMPLYMKNSDNANLYDYNGTLDLSWAVRPYIVKTGEELTTDQVRGYHKPGYKYNLIWLNQ